MVGGCKEDQTRLILDMKLVLLVDLDQTLIHTTNDSIPPNLKDVYHFQLYGQNSPWYHTRVRLGTAYFLQKISALYELHICTRGCTPTPLLPTLTPIRSWWLKCFPTLHMDHIYHMS